MTVMEIICSDPETHAILIDVLVATVPLILRAIVRPELLYDATPKLMT